jgi:spermidine synthase
VIGDAAEFIRDKSGEYDVIIVDSSDPNEGPAESLFTPEFYSNLSKALAPGGIVCTQGECMWQNLELIKQVMTKAKEFFPVVDYAYSCVPTYPSGQIGYLVCSKAKCPLYARCNKRAIPAEVAPFLRYYSESMHRASFQLPKFAETALADIRPPSRSYSHSTADYALYGGILAAAVAVGAVLGAYARRK